MNSPILYNDPSGHMRINENGSDGTKGCADKDYCDKAQKKSDDERAVWKAAKEAAEAAKAAKAAAENGGGTGTPTATPTNCPIPRSECVPTATATPTGPYYESAPSTSTPAATPTPFGYETVHNPAIQELVANGMPSLIPSPIEFDVNGAWDTALKTIPPFLGIPATSFTDVLSNGMNTLLQASSDLLLGLEPSIAPIGVDIFPPIPLLDDMFDSTNPSIIT